MDISNWSWQNNVYRLYHQAKRCVSISLSWTETFKYLPPVAAGLQAVWGRQREQQLTSSPQRWQSPELLDSKPSHRKPSMTHSCWFEETRLWGLAQQQEPRSPDSFPAYRHPLEAVPEVWLASAKNSLCVMFRWCWPSADCWWSAVALQVAETDTAKHWQTVGDLQFCCRLLKEIQWNIGKLLVICSSVADCWNRYSGTSQTVGDLQFRYRLLKMATAWAESVFSASLVCRCDKFVQWDCEHHSHCFT